MYVVMCCSSGKIDGQNRSLIIHIFSLKVCICQESFFSISYRKKQTVLLYCSFVKIHGQKKLQILYYCKIKPPVVKYSNTIVFISCPTNFINNNLVNIYVPGENVNEIG
jgi:hypothetical protein